jgi:hypothetical protein
VRALRMSAARFRGLGFGGTSKGWNGVMQRNPHRCDGRFSDEWSSTGSPRASPENPPRKVLCTADDPVAWIASSESHYYEPCVVYPLTCLVSATTLPFAASAKSCTIQANRAVDGLNADPNRNIV